MTPPQWYVLTGAPSSGKSTLISELKKRGYKTVEEAARFVIERAVATGADYRELRKDAARFQREVLQMKIDTEAALSHSDVIFYDRGIPDSVAYYEVEGVHDGGELRAALENCDYRKIFVLDLISKENLIADGARSETWEDAQKLDLLLEKTYSQLGYDVVRVPVLPLEERADFVLANL
jgi:predicted ATPase